MNTETKLQPTRMSSRLHNVAEDGEILQLKDGQLHIDTTEDSDDGTWLRVSDYTRFANKVDSHDTEAIQNFLIGARRKKLDWGAFILEKDSFDGLIITFKEPIQVCFGEVGGNPVIQKVSKLKGEITYDFFRTRNGRQDTIANGIEFLLENIEFIF